MVVDDVDEDELIFSSAESEDGAASGTTTTTAALMVKAVTMEYMTSAGEMDSFCLYNSWGDVENIEKCVCPL